MPAVHTHRHACLVQFFNDSTVSDAEYGRLMEEAEELDRVDEIEAELDEWERIQQQYAPHAA